MNVRELIDILQCLNPEAIVYVGTDHGQDIEQARNVKTCNFSNKCLPYIGNDLVWRDWIPSDNAILIQ